MVQLADGKTVEVRTACRVDFTVGDRSYREIISYLPNLSADMVLGIDLLAKMQVKLDLGRDLIIFDDCPIPRDNEQPQGPTHNTITPVMPLPTWPADQNPTTSGYIPADTDRTHETRSRTDRIPLTLTADEEHKLNKFLARQLPLFEKIKGTTPLIQHEIRLTETEPIKQRYQPQNPRMQAVINEEVDRMLADGIIEPSRSPWSSPVVIAKKKDGAPRFCINFKKINDISRKDAYPLPFINAILDKLRRAKYISSIDLKQGYWQIPLTEDSKPITAFTVPGRGLFQFKVMPFGLHSAPATFQRLMDRILGPELEPFCFAYLDDIIILGETYDEHENNLLTVFERLRAANLKINSAKCQFGRKSLKYLGHLVTSEGICTDPDKVDAILELREPTNVRGVRRFLGVASWYRRFVPNFSQIAAPLNHLLKKGVRWSWGTEQTEAFNQLKRCLTETPVLTCPDFTKKFVLQTDASQEGLGIALIQHGTDGDHVIAYASRTLTASEKKYSVTEKECLAIVWGIEKMRPYLEGYHFTVITDHQSLRWLHSIKSPSGRLARWSVYLQQFDFDIRYRKGVLNRIADTLSRDPVAHCTDEITDPIYTLEEFEPCSWYRSKKTAVENNPSAFPDFTVREGRLYRHFWDMSDMSESEMAEPWKVCVPKSARLAVLQENHDQPTAGHLGIAKTTARVARKYYWPGMFRDIGKYVRKCSSCQRYKTSQQTLPGKMHPSRNQLPWETVSTDIVGPLPRSSKGNSYMVVFQDRFTKWVQCRPIRKATSKAVSQAFYEEVFARFGCPKTVISDNGTQFTGQTFESLLKDLGIAYRLTPPYTPQANPVERTNKTLKTMVAQFCEADHRKWDTHLPDLVFAINSSRHDSTGFSPAFLNFGREMDPPRPLYRIPVSPEMETVTTDTETADFVDQNARLKKLDDIYELVRINLGRAFSTQSRHYNLRRREWRCHVGDKVMKKENPLSSAVKGFAAKLAPKYSGPYTVCKVVSPVVYDLKTSTGATLRRIHIKDLKPTQ